jgi:integral membrane protein
VNNGGFGKGGASAVWSPIHGVIFFVFVLSIANLGFKVGWSLPRMILVMMSGFVPVLPFVIERKVAREVEARLAAQDAQVASQ